MHVPRSRAPKSGPRGRAADGDYRRATPFLDKRGSRGGRNRPTLTRPLPRRDPNPSATPPTPRPPSTGHVPSKLVPSPPQLAWGAAPSLVAPTTSDHDCEMRSSSTVNRRSVQNCTRIGMIMIDDCDQLSDTMTMESNAILRKAAADHDTLYDELNGIFESQKGCPS
eukprot:COSAG02_NODE_138_length_34440_cov_16.694368_20_plen_167_part_00